MIVIRGEVNMNYNEALKLATKMHKGQLRKYSGYEYITHPIAVADRFEEESDKIVAILHLTCYENLTSKLNTIL